MKWQRLMWILWPSFLAAGVGAGMAFAFIDPLDVHIFGRAQLSRMGFYTVSFFVLWALGALSSALTVYLLPPGNSPADARGARIFSEEP